MPRGGGEEQRTAPANSVDALGPSVMDCGVYLPGCRQGGRAVAVVELARLEERPPTLAALAQLLAYYHTVPRKSAAKHGLVVLVVGRADRFPAAFALVEQLVACHDDAMSPFSRERLVLFNGNLSPLKDLERKCIDDVVIWSEGSPSIPVQMGARSV